MREKVSPVKYIPYFILTSALSLILTLSLADFLYMKADVRALIGVISALNVVLYILYLYPAVYILIGVSAGIYALSAFSLHGVSFLTHISSAWRYACGTGKWLAEYMYGNGQPNSSLGLTVVYAGAVLIVIGLFILIIYRHLSIIPLIVGIGVLSDMWFSGYDTALKRLWQYCAVGFILYGYANYDVSESRWRAKNYRHSKGMMASWLGYTCAIVAAACLLINILPTDIKPINNVWLNRNVFDRISDFTSSETFGRYNGGRDDGRFSISSVGYQNSATKLGGPVSISNRLMLKVKLDGNVKNQIYLRGTVKDIYTGSMWDRTDEKAADVKSNEPAGADFGNDGNVDGYDYVLLTVYPQELLTTSLFNIWKPYSADVPTSKYGCNGSGEFFLSRSGRGREYKVASRLPRVYDDQLRSAPSSPDAKGNGLAKYLQLSETVTPRVKSLSHQITDGYSNDYDKACAIRNYLKENYSYSLDPSELPEGRDFVDYFLFDGKEGYCTYFASAMTVMCRINSIPARYVEGFVLGSGDKSSDGLYDVYSKKAHAWVEVYFDGYGWVTFEPTAGFDGLDYERHDGGQITPAITPGTSVTPTTSAPAKNPDAGDEEDIPVKGPAAETRPTVPLYAIIMLVLFAAVIIRAALKAYLDFKRIRMADRLDGREAAMEYMGIFEQKLKRGGIIREDGETPDEFGIRVNDVMSGYDIDIEALMRMFGEIRFGNRPMGKDQRREFTDAIRSADMFVRKRRGTIRYLLYRFVL